MSKKLLALLLAMIMIVGSFTSVLADTADKKAEEPAKTEEKADEKAEEPAKTEEKEEEKKEEEPVKTNDEALDKAIAVLKKAGFITGYSADSDDFKVEKNVKRSEFASMIVRAKGLEASAKALATVPTGFKDVPTNHWANGYIAVAKQQGFVNGYTDGTFRPDRQISYQDMATMLTIALGQAEVGTVYPAGYIVKAQQLGLFNNVNVPAYTDMATRGDVFKMLYNMITSKEFGERKIVKAIVLENSRVEKMDDNEIVAEVIKVVQEANWVQGNRDKRGDQHKYVLSKDLKLDAEDLLGKVVDLTVNKEDKIVDVTVDDTYKYLEGPITNVDYKKFGVNWTNYTALFDERYDREDERIFRTYLNDKDYKYEDFAKEYKEGKYDFAKVTVKNGKVIFIDAYQFNDIAPVAESKDGNVYYYDDKDSARVKKAADLMSRVIISTDGVYTVGERKEVAADDVIHFYDGYRKAIVKKNARTDQKLVETKRDRNGVEYLVLEDKSEPWLNYKVPFRAVYSYEGKEFRVAITRGNFEPIVGRKVKALIALDGSVQLVQSDLAWDDGIQAIKKITSYGEVNLLASKGAEIWSKEGRDTSYYDARVNNRALVDKFEKNDIVFYRGDGEEGKDKVTKAMYLLFKKHDGTLANKTGYSNQFKPADLDYRYIKVKAQTSSVSARNMGYYRYFDNLNAYAYDKHGNLQPIPDMAKFVELNNPTKNPELEAFVVSELELKNMLRTSYKIDSFNFLSNDKAADEVARVVVFKNAKGAGTKYEDFYAEVINKYDYTDRVLFRDAAGKEWLVKVEKDGEEIYKEGDIVKLYVDKATLDKDLKEGYVDLTEPRLQNLAALNREPVESLNRWSKPYAVKAIQYRRTYKIDVDGNGKFDDAVDEVIFIDDDTAIFNDSNFGWIQLARNTDYTTDAHKGFIDVIRFVDGPYVEPKAEGVYTRLRKDLSDKNYVVICDENDIHDFIRLRVEADTRILDKDGHVVGFGPAGLDNSGYLTSHDMGEVEYNLDKNGRLLTLKFKRTLAQIQDDDLDKAVALVASLGDQEYGFGKTSLERATEFANKVVEILHKNGLKENNNLQIESGDKVIRRITNGDPAMGTNGGDGELETKLESLSGKKATVKTKFHQTTQAELDEIHANKVVDAAKDEKITATSTTTADQVKDAVVTIVNPKLAAEDKITTENIEVTGTAPNFTVKVKIGTITKPLAVKFN